MRVYIILFRKTETSSNTSLAARPLSNLLQATSLRGINWYVCKICSELCRLNYVKDFATMSLSHSPRDIVVHHQSFIPSLIRPFIKDFELFLYIPRFPSYICETDVINVAGNIFSLVLLPPDATYQIMSDSSEAVKVLQGSLGWLDSQSDLIERTCASRHPGCATSMVVDSPDGHVRSGGDGAVFIRMRPSKETNTCTLRALNTLPSFYPCDVRDHTFAWKQAAREPRLPKIKGGIEEDCTTALLFYLFLVI